MKMITILGPTASGKTAVAARLAHDIGGEILSADSRQVYRGMDIGTGKDLEDYVVEGQQVPYHLIDIVDAGTKYNLFQYQQDFTVPTTISAAVASLPFYVAARASTLRRCSRATPCRLSPRTPSCAKALRERRFPN